MSIQPRPQRRRVPAPRSPARPHRWPHRRCSTAQQAARLARAVRPKRTTTRHSHSEHQLPTRRGSSPRPWRAAAPTAMPRRQPFRRSRTPRARARDAPLRVSSPHPQENASTSGRHPRTVPALAAGTAPRTARVPHSQPRPLATFTHQSDTTRRCRQLQPRSA